MNHHLFAHSPPIRLCSFAAAMNFAGFSKRDRRLQRCHSARSRRVSEDTNNWRQFSGFLPSSDPLLTSYSHGFSETVPRVQLAFLHNRIPRTFEAVGEVQGAMKSAAFVPLQGALHDQLCDLREVSQFE